MQVLETSSRLRLRTRRSWGTFWLGFLFTSFGLVILAAFAQLITLICTQGQPITCTLTRQDLLLRSQTQMIRGLRGAEMEASEDDEGDSTYRIVLLTDSGRVPLTEYYSSGLQKHRVLKDKVDQFINSNQPHLDISQDDRWMGVLIGGSFSGFGLLFLLPVFNSTTITFDKSQGKFYIHEVSLFTNRRHEYPLYQLQRLEKRESTDSDGDTTYSLVAVLTSGEHLSLPKELLEYQQQVNRFLGLKDPEGLSQV